MEYNSAQRALWTMWNGLKKLNPQQLTHIQRTVKLCMCLLRYTMYLHIAYYSTQCICTLPITVHNVSTHCLLRYTMYLHIAYYGTQCICTLPITVHNVSTHCLLRYAMYLHIAYYGTQCICTLPIVHNVSTHCLLHWTNLIQSELHRLLSHNVVVSTTRSNLITWELEVKKFIRGPRRYVW